MSLCDRCYAPGICCQHMSLSGGKGDLGHLLRGSADDAKRWVAEHNLPLFEPAYAKDDGFGQGPTWRFTCKALAPDGRCTVYETRPDLCRRFEPQQDGLCVHHGGAEAGDASVGLE